MLGAAAVAVTGALTDLLRGKIYNWLTLPAILVGIGVSSCVHGWSGLCGSLLAVGLGFLLYGWIYLLGAMAAGDVKFLMALAAWGSPNPSHFVVDTAILGIVLGGAVALVSLAARGKLIAFIRKIWRLFYSSALSAIAGDFEIEPPSIDRAATIPFGVPLACAATWAAFADPLVRWLWGGGLWMR
jgi:prepilin peptidase CpaA